MKNDSELWESISKGLPLTPSPPDLIPLPEIIRVLKYCLDGRVEKYDIAMQLLDCMDGMRDDVEFLNWKAMVEYEAKRYLRSFKTAEKILSTIRNSDTLFNAGRAAYKANELEKSEEYLRECMKLNPDDSTIALDYSVTVCTMGDFDRAFEIIQSIDQSKLDARHSKIVDFNKGWHFINRGDFVKGMEYLHLGREINVWGSDARRYDRPKWDGEVKPGKTILIAGEGGIGDEVINARFAENIKSLGMRCLMSTVHGNQSMLGSVSALDKVIDHREIDQESWDYWIPCMDLPYAMKLDIPDIPRKPYLNAKPDYINKWKMLSDAKIKIGIRWSGNPRYELELARTVPPELFERLEDLDVQLYSFQKSDGDVNMYIPRNAINIAERLETWDDTMGAMENMDLIITSCTSVAHVSGALGRPTWILLPLLPYYTWVDMEKTSYWYDAVRLYRQHQWKDWSLPFDEVYRDLKALLDERERK